MRAGHVVLATGGAGQLFSVTTNPPESTGDGVAMALRAGVPTADVEFVQFHPTALHHPAMPRPLLSEALRGHGALLRDRDGERFVDELAPRDVVSRAMAARMAEQGVDHLWLDATGLERFAQRFPTIAASLPSHRARPRARLAADRAGRPPPLGRRGHRPVGRHRAARACGRPARWPAPASTGPTGWPPTRCSRAWCSAPAWPSASPPGAEGPAPTGALRAVLGGEPLDGIGCSASAGRCPAPPGGAGTTDARAGGADVDQAARRAAAGHDRGAGVVRSAESLDGARAVVDEWPPLLGDRAGLGGRAGELANLLTVGRALLVSAAARDESRGAHARADFPDTEPRGGCRLVHGRVPATGVRPPGDARREADRHARRPPPGAGRARPWAGPWPRTWARRAT